MWIIGPTKRDHVRPQPAQVTRDKQAESNSGERDRVTAEVERSETRGNEPGESAIAIPVVTIIRVRECGVSTESRRTRTRYSPYAARFQNREGAQEKRIRNAELSRCSSDPERQGADGKPS